MENDELTENQFLLSIQSGNSADVLAGLKHGGAYFRFQAILAAIDHDISTAEVILQLRVLLKDERVVLGEKICDFAKVALYKYDGYKVSRDDRAFRLLDLIKQPGR